MSKSISGLWFVCSVVWCFASIVTRTLASEVTIQLFDKTESVITAPGLALTEEPFDSSSPNVIMRSASGLKFACRKSSFHPGVLEVKSSCLLSNYDAQQYWQYELCFGSNVSQVHLENGRVQSRVNLGTFKSSETLGQVFEGGSGGRSVRVAFLCDQDADKPKIVRAEEPSPLKYVLSVALKGACEHQHIAPLESMPCVEAIAGGYHIKVCPSKVVTIKKELTLKGQVNLPVEYTQLETTKELKRRRQEVFLSSTVCSSSPDTPLRARVSYHCTPKQKWPLILGIEGAKCEAFIRVAVASICESSNIKIDCKLQGDDDD